MEFNPEKLEVVAKKHKISLILLFGSRASGKYSLTSDLDLGVLFEDAIWDRTALISDLMTVFPDYILDVVILNHSDPVLKFEIISNYYVLYCLYPEIFFGFYTSTVKQYQDIQKFLHQEDIYLNNYLGGTTLGIRECHPPQIDSPD